MKERTEVIEKLLVKYLPKAEGYQSQIMEAMEYSVMAGGKRLRPMLMQETYRLFGGTEKFVEPFMAGMEMIPPESISATQDTVFTSWVERVTRAPVSIFPKD